MGRAQAKSRRMSAITPPSGHPDGPRDAGAAAPDALRLAVHLPDAEATARLARALGARLGAGDVLLLDGQIGAGKTHFARALIQHRLLAGPGRAEDVPSPTFTLVQTYDLGDLEIWHADLYRLTAPEEAEELGLDEAFSTALCLVEWPDRLAGLAPDTALALSLAPEGPGDGRRLLLQGPRDRWAERLDAALAEAGLAEIPEGDPR